MKEKYLKPSNIKNFKIDHFISTDTASFFIGDKDSIDKERNKDKGKKKSGWEDEYNFNKYIIVDPDDYSPAPLSARGNYENVKLNLNRNFFTITLGADTSVPFFLFVFNKKIDSFFWPIILDDQDGFMNWSKKWNEKNTALKKLILNQFSKKKSKWVKIGKLNIPSKKLLIQEAHFIHNEYYLTYESKKEFDIFAIYSVKKDLYKIYSDPEEADFIKDMGITFPNDSEEIPDDTYMFYGLFFKSRDRD